MGKYSDYSIISIGDHCAIPIILKEIEIRKCSYPFDWVTKVEQLHDTNIIYNTQLISELVSTKDIDEIVKKYIGNAFENNKEKNINTENNIWFPHDGGDINDIFEKYKRRFNRLKDDLNKKNIFSLLTRHFYIEEETFKKIREQLLSYNSESIILFISGSNHKYLENNNYENVIFKHIDYDISKYSDYDWTTFRPNLKTFLSELLL